MVDEEAEELLEEDEGADPVKVVTAPARAALSVAKTAVDALKHFIQGDEPEEQEEDETDEESDSGTE